MYDLSLDTVKDELRRLSDMAAEMEREVALLDTTGATWVSGRPLTPRERERSLAGARRQLTTYRAMHAAVEALVAGRSDYMTDATRQAARTLIAEARDKGFDDDRTTGYLAAWLPIKASMTQSAAGQLAREIVHELKCKI